MAVAAGQVEWLIITNKIQMLASFSWNNGVNAQCLLLLSVREKELAVFPKVKNFMFPIKQQQPKAVTHAKNWPICSVVKEAASDFWSPLGLLVEPKETGAVKKTNQHGVYSLKQSSLHELMRPLVHWCSWRCLGFVQRYVSSLKAKMGFSPPPTSKLNISI